MRMVRARLSRILRPVYVCVACLLTQVHNVQLPVPTVSSGATLQVDSVVSWIRGPFAHDRVITEKLLQQELESGGILAVRRTLRQRTAIRVMFSADNKFEVPVELRWAPFRGNMKVVRIGVNDSSLWLYPGQSALQYTSAGHLFVVMTRQGNEEYQRASQPLVELENAFKQVIGLCLVPFSLSGTNVSISSSSPAMFNAQKLLEATVHYPECNSYMSGALTLAESIQDSATRGCFRRMLLTYWEHQRLSQVPVHLWAVPAISVATSPSSASDISSMGGVDHPKALWTLGSLSRTLIQEAFAWHTTHRTVAASAEPPISLVFNQLESPTFHVPLPGALMQRIVDEVRQQVATWLGVAAETLEVTGQYGCREYRNGAVVRWHVDPVETQPLTAIIHIADDRTSTSAGPPRSQWSLQLPKSLEEFGRYNVTALASPRTFLIDRKDGTRSYDATVLETIDLQVGQVLIVQSAKLPHARLQPFTGDWYANAFVHFAPRGWAEQDAVQALLD
jgi:hypothetical protein